MRIHQCTASIPVCCWFESAGGRGTKTAVRASFARSKYCATFLFSELPIWKAAPGNNAPSCVLTYESNSNLVDRIQVSYRRTQQGMWYHQFSQTDMSNLFSSSNFNIYAIINNEKGFFWRMIFTEFELLAFLIIQTPSDNNICWFFLIRKHMEKYGKTCQPSWKFSLSVTNYAWYRFLFNKIQISFNH